jgi:hypothetical protein
MSGEAVATEPGPTAHAVLNDAFQRLRIPPLAQRVALGVLVFLGVYIGVVGLPSYAIQVLQSQNIPINLSPTNLMYFGGAMAVLSGAQYAVRPYRAYGPVAIGTNVAELLYLWLLYQTSPIRLSLGGGNDHIAIALGFATVVLLLMLVTLISLAGDAVTTYEDFRKPAERLYWTYPTR